MRFDGYAGTLRVDRPMDEVAQVLGHALGATVTRGKAMRRYGEVLRVEHGGHCAVWVGRDVGNESIYFEGKGETTPALVEAVRKYLPAHTVARADVCEDFDAEGSFEALQAVVRAHKGPRVKAGYVALPDDAEEGRTWASGARGGVSYIRLYEAGKMRERLHYCRPNWTRLELEARPHYARDKQAAARMEPLEFWGFSAWSRRVAEAVTASAVPKYEQTYTPPTGDRTTLYLARTFRRHWQEMLAEGRDWACIGRELEAVWHADDEAEEFYRRAKQ